MRKADRLEQAFYRQISPDSHEHAPLRRSDITTGKLVLRKRGPGGALLPNKQRVSIFLDGAVVGHFKARAGDRGHQTLINQALKRAIQADTIEAIVRKTIREELRRARALTALPRRESPGAARGTARRGAARVA